MWRQPPIWEPKGTKVPTVQHHHADLFSISESSLDVYSADVIDRRLNTKKVREHVVEKEKPIDRSRCTGKLRYARYYEHDGVLRAYANRAMVLAFLCVPTTMLALAFAVYVRLQPPTVVRVDEHGLTTILGVNKPSISVTQGQGSEPTEFEKRAFVRLFLERYLTFHPRM